LTIHRVQCQFCGASVNKNGWKAHSNTNKCKNSRLRTSQKIKRSKRVTRVPSQGAVKIVRPKKRSSPIRVKRSSPTSSSSVLPLPSSLIYSSSPSVYSSPIYDFDPRSPIKQINVKKPSYIVTYERLPKTDVEFSNIERLVKNDMYSRLSIQRSMMTNPRVGEIKKIIKINNPMLLERFNDKLGLILSELGDLNACNIAPMFHGTSLKAIKPIAEGGYLQRLNTTSRYGKGNYFSPSANVASDYAHKGADNVGIMFLNQVILGISKDTTDTPNRYFSSLIQNKPDPMRSVKRIGSPGGHSGTNASISVPGFSGSVFVVPDDDMALPTHIIFFKFLTR
jgi:hypothetical protein